MNGDRERSSSCSILIWFSFNYWLMLLNQFPALIGRSTEEFATRNVFVPFNFHFAASRVLFRCWENSTYLSRKHSTFRTLNWSPKCCETMAAILDTWTVFEMNQNGVPLNMFISITKLNMRTFNSIARNNGPASSKDRNFGRTTMGFCAGTMWFSFVSLENPNPNNLRCIHSEIAYQANPAIDYWIHSYHLIAWCDYYLWYSLMSAWPLQLFAIQRPETDTRRVHWVSPFNLARNERNFRRPRADDEAHELEFTRRMQFMLIWNGETGCVAQFSHSKI